jgi:RimJ/RimL family protein N-acetyltransferase
MTAIPRVETARLLLRGFEERDLDAFAAMQADAEVMRFISPTGPRERDVTWRDMAQAIGHWALRGHGLWAVEERGTGAFLGRVGIIRPEGWPEIELAYSLVRGAWGRGLATEAGRAALGWAFGALGVPRVASFIAPANLASQAVSRRLGAACEGEAVLLGSMPVQWWVHRPG